ncbi:hypothetical protein EV382_1137 [Micromonospora violae]|uniref:Uncharacterized protein n=1 Tax=Micromonospora violae TaxID=1278207 RepID=A0A4Q7UD41_9ACTN|nr:hypothetical protein [Micromonospora violae]RZT77961.1 hypothetical protein EV382_1137 [Micromonospora violae]
MTASNEDQELINKLMELLKRTDEWMEQEAPAVQPGSALARDNALTHPHQVSHAAIQSIGNAVDHLHSMRSALWDHENNQLTLHTYSPFTLTRGALENASAAIWMLLPSNRKERVRRRLWYELANTKNAESLRTETHLPDDGGLQRRKDRVLGLADAAGIDRATLRGKPSYKDFLEESGHFVDLIDGESNPVYIMWKMCSAVAHGDTWIIPLFDLQMIRPLEPGVSTYRVTAPTPLLYSGVQAAMVLVIKARELFSQRAASHL